MGKKHKKNGKNYDWHDYPWDDENDFENNYEDESERPVAESASREQLSEENELGSVSVPVESSSRHELSDENELNEPKRDITSPSRANCSEENVFADTGNATESLSRRDLSNDNDWDTGCNTDNAAQTTTNEPENPQEQNQYQDRAKVPLGCKMAEKLASEHMITAVQVPPLLLIYNPQGGCFEKVQKQAFFLFARRAFQGCDYDDRLTLRLASEVFDRLLSTPDLQGKMDDFDAEQPFLNVLNGVVDLRTGKLLPHSPDYRFCSSIQANYLADKPMKANRFHQFLDDHFPDEANRLLFLQSFAYLLSWFRSNKICPFFIGKKDTGKTIMAKLLKHLLGHENTSELRLEQLTNRFGMSGILHARVNICHEVERSTLKQTGIIKSISGDDYLGCEFKGKDFFTCAPRTKLAFVGNYPFRVAQTAMEDAFSNRLLFVEFLNSTPLADQIAEFDLLLFDKERDEILTELVYVLMGWLQGERKFEKSKQSEQWLSDFKRQEGSFMDYFQETYIHKKDGRVWICDILERNELWCKENGYAILPMNQRREILRDIAREWHLVKKKFRFRKDENPRAGYIHLALKSPAEI